MACVCDMMVRNTANVSPPLPSGAVRRCDEAWRVCRFYFWKGHRNGALPYITLCGLQREYGLLLVLVGRIHSVLCTALFCISASASLRLCVSASLRLCISASLHLCTSAPLSAFPHMGDSVKRQLSGNRPATGWPTRASTPLWGSLHTPQVRATAFITS